MFVDPIHEEGPGPVEHADRPPVGLMRIATYNVHVTDPTGGNEEFRASC